MKMCGLSTAIFFFGMGESGFIRGVAISKLKVENSIGIEHVVVYSILMIKGKIPTTHFV